MTASVTALKALQACLAAEHAAIYGYGVLGGVLAAERPTEPQYELAAEGYVAHRARRDALTALIVDMKAAPVPAEPAYATPFRIADVSACRRLGRHIEHRTAAVYSFAVAKTANAARRVVAHALADAALREVRWGAEAQAFPGVADF